MKDEPDAQDLRMRGVEALIHALGREDALRFVQQIQSGSQNYTVDRHLFLPELSTRELVEQLRRASNEKL